MKSRKKDYFSTDELADNAVDYIREADADKSLFIYTAFTAPHYPLHARQKTIDKYAGRYDCGWDKLREQRIKRMKKLGILPADYKAPPRDPGSIPWEQEKNKKWQAQRMQTYAAMVDEMDQAIGRIVNALKRFRDLDNTLLIFISDNGASCEGHLNNTAERLGTPWKSDMIPKTAPDGKEVIPGDFPGMPLGGAHTYGSYGLRWASVSNSPFQRHKSWVHEGGISAPCIVHWPNRIKDIGAIRGDIAHIMDFMPTFTAVSGSEYPSTFNGKKIQPMQGISLLPAIDNKAIKRDYICWEHEGNRAIRHGRWKLVSEYPGSWITFYPKMDGKWRLYDIEADRGELNDLSAKHPEKVKHLEALYETWAKRSNVIDWDKLAGKKL